MELLDSTEKLVEAKNQIAKLQTCVDNIMKKRVRLIVVPSVYNLIFFLSFLRSSLF